MLLPMHLYIARVPSKSTHQSYICAKALATPMHAKPSSWSGPPSLIQAKATICLHAHTLCHCTHGCVL